MEIAATDIVLQLPSGAQVEIAFMDNGVSVECQSKKIAESVKAATEDLRAQVSPADGDPNHATARLLAERFEATVVRVTPVPAPATADGEEVIY